MKIRKIIGRILSNLGCQMSGNEIVVHRIRIGKKKLSEIPDEDRSLLFMLGHIRNEISILDKLLLYASNYDYQPNTIEDHAHTSQALMFTKILAGKINEAWKFVKTPFLRTPLGKTYVPLLDGDGQKALESLKKYFRRDKFIRDARNEFFFHYMTEKWSERLTEVFNKMEDDEAEFYVSTTPGNTHWYGAEVMLNYTLLQSIVHDDPEKAMDEFVGTTVKLSRWMTTFLNRCIKAIVEKHLGSNFLAKHMEPITISNVPDYTKVNVPFFVYVPE